VKSLDLLMVDREEQFSMNVYRVVIVRHRSYLLVYNDRYD